MKKTIFLKLFSGYFFLILILSSVILIFSFITIREHYINVLTVNLKNQASVLRLKIVPFLIEKHFDKLDVLVRQLGKEIDSRITIIDINGIVLSDSVENKKLMENHKNRAEVIDALNGNTGTSLRFSSTAKEKMLYVAIPIKENNKIIGVLRLSLFLKQVNTLLDSLKMKIINIVLIVIIISLIFAYVLSASLSKPIKSLADASRQIAKGNFNTKIFLKSTDELKELSDSFNYMTEEVKALFAELSRQKEELNSIISTIQEGLLVLDKEGKIILCNKSFEDIVKNGHIKGKLYWEICREPELSELVKRVWKDRENLTGEIQLYDKKYLFSATFFSIKEEIIILLHDITEIKNIEKIKKDFIVNVSHELRTPLTAIKGFVETLEGTTEKKNKQYLEIIKRNTDRLISIVKDLLLLSELEDKGLNLELEKVNLKKLIEDVVKIFEQKTKEKKLPIKINVNDEVLDIKADFFRLEQLFINLIDNAVKYTEKGEIAISVNKNGENIIIKIEDTGIGIPKEHLSRIFERFYVVDKSRSRILGGTGLGLSIVKHIVLLHNGSINVESTVGVGTSFTIFLPAKQS